MPNITEIKVVIRDLEKQIVTAHVTEQNKIKTKHLTWPFLGINFDEGSIKLIARRTSLLVIVYCIWLNYFYDKVFLNCVVRIDVVAISVPNVSYLKFYRRLK